MRLFIYIIAASFLFFGCATQRKTDKIIVSSEDSKIDENIISEKKTLLTWSDLLSFRESEDIEINIKKYDTTAKPDSTGRFPLIEEQTLKSNRNTQKEQIVSGEKKTESNLTKIKRTERKIKSNERLKTGYSMDVAGGNYIVWLWIALAIIGGVLLYFLIPKVFKKW